MLYYHYLMYIIYFSALEYVYSFSALEINIFMFMLIKIMIFHFQTTNGSQVRASLGKQGYLLSSTY